MSKNKDIIKYAEEQLASFDKVKFNMVDSLVLCQLIYMYYDEIVPGIEIKDASMRIGDMLKAEDIPHITKDVFFPDKCKDILIAVGMSPRFRDVKMCCYRNNLDIGEEKQFAAVTFLLNEDTAYLAYRGTDMNIVAWKENFNMAYMSDVPAQKEGREYLETIAKMYSHKLYIGGHSKGGNIAVYAAKEVSADIQDRIISIYNHDGPGFKDEIFKSDKYQKIKNKIYKTVPESSLVGMLMKTQEDQLVVESNGTWILQHSPFTWIVEGNDFKYQKNINPGADYINGSLNDWISAMTEDERKDFTELFFKIFDDMGVSNLDELTENWHKKALVFLSSVKDMDPDSKHFISQILKSLLKTHIKNIGSQANKKS